MTRRQQITRHLLRLVHARSQWDHRQAVAALQDLFEVPEEARLRLPGSAPVGPPAPKVPKPPKPPRMAPAFTHTRSWRLMRRHRTPLAGSPEWAAAQVGKIPA